jgi:hypothetical protein
MKAGEQKQSTTRSGSPLGLPALVTLDQWLLLAYKMYLKVLLVTDGCSHFKSAFANFITDSRREKGLKALQRVVTRGVPR